MSNSPATSSDVSTVPSLPAAPPSTQGQVPAAPVNYGWKWESILAGKKEAETIILKRGVDISVVMAFGELSYMNRLAILSSVRELDNSFRQKSVPVLTVFLVYILGSLVVVGNVGGNLYGSLAGAGLVLVGSVGVAWVGRRDAAKESKHAAWLKALESVDAEAIKRENSSTK